MVRFPIGVPILALASQLFAQGTAEKAPEPETSQQATIEIPGMKKLVISGQYRLRYEGKFDYDFNRDAPDSNDFFTQRVRLGFAPQLTDTISGLIQIQDAREWGEETSTLDDSADGFDLHQGYVEVDHFPGIGGKAKVGRQSVALGSQRLISSLEWSTQGRVFDGYRHSWQCDQQSVDAFFFQTRETLNTAVNDDAVVGGLWGTRHFGEHALLDLYAIFLHDDQTSAGGIENRLTLGGRWKHDVDGLSYGAELATQTGKVDGADIPIGETYAVAVDLGYTLHEASGKPFVQAEVNLASGNDPSTSDNERFNTLFPFAHFYLGYMDFALWENIEHATLQAGFEPCQKSKVTAYWHFFRAMEAADRFGGPANTLSPGAAGQSRTMGNELDLKFNYDFGTMPAKTYLEVGYGLFLPGAGTKAAKGADDPAHFVYVQGDLRF